MQEDRLNALAKREWFYVLEELVLGVGLLEQVVGDLGVEVVDMVEADVAAEPLKHFGELEEGRAFQGRVLVIPIGVTTPVGFLKLVLDIEEEYTD